MNRYFLAILLACILFTQCKKNNTKTTDQEYFDYNLDGVDYHFTQGTDTLTVTTTSLFGSPMILMYVSCFRRTASTPGYIILTCAQPNPTTGTYPSSQPCEVNAMSISTNSVQVIQTSFASNINEQFEGTFSGNFINAGITHVINGSFRVKRNY